MCDCEQIKNTDEYVIAWRAWMEVDFEIVEYNSVENCWEDMPYDGFQAMRLWYNDGTCGKFISGNDFYFLWEHPKGLVFGQSNDLDIAERYPGAIIKRGKHVPDNVIKEVNELMINSKTPLNAD